MSGNFNKNIFSSNIYIKIMNNYEYKINSIKNKKIKFNFFILF